MTLFLKAYFKNILSINLSINISEQTYGVHISFPFYNSENEFLEIFHYLPKPIQPMKANGSIQIQSVLLQRMYSLFFLFLLSR